MKVHQNNALGEFGSAIGKGLLAGLAGTAAITISQVIEMAITKRKASEATLKVAEKTIQIKPATNAAKYQLSQEVHWAYGTMWGIGRGIIGLTGLKGIPAIAVQFAAIWGTELLMLPAFKAAPPISEQDPKTIALDAMHHIVYATAASMAYEVLDAGSKNERRLRKLVEKLSLKMNV